MSKTLGIFLPFMLIVISVLSILRFVHALRPRMQPAGAGSKLSETDYAFVVGALPSREADPLVLTPIDHMRFDAIVREVHEAYSRDDAEQLAYYATPALCAQIQSMQLGNTSHGVAERISGIKMVSNKVIKLWREGTNDLVTLQFTLVVTMALFDVKTNTAVSGENNVSETMVELWTFQRPISGRWYASKIEDV